MLQVSSMVPAQVQHIHGAVLAGGHLPQAAEGQLERPLVEHVVLAEVLKLPLPGHLQGVAVLALAPHADAGGGVAGVAHGGGTAGAHPVLAAVVALVLLLEPLLQHLAELFQVVGGAGVYLVLVVFFHVLGVMEPVHELLGDVLDVLDAVEIIQENFIELVKVGLGLDQNGPADIVKLQQAVAAQAPLQGLHQRQPLVHGHLQALGTHVVKQVRKQTVSLLSRWRMSTFLPTEAVLHAVLGVLHGGEVLVFLQQDAGVGQLGLDLLRVHAAQAQGLEPSPSSSEVEGFLATVGRSRTW